MITRTFDYRLVKRLWPFPFALSPECYYLVHGKNEGMWLVEPENGKMVIHAQLGESVRGAAARDSAIAVFDWIFKNTSHTKIYAEIPKDNPKACFMASWSGMNFTHETEEFRWYEVNKYEWR